MTNPIATTLDAYEQGHAALLVTGRSLHDLVVDDEQAIRPAIETLRRTLRQHYGMHLMTYSLADGFDWDDSRVSDVRDRATIEQVLRAHGLHDVPHDQQELPRVLRSVGALTRAPRGGLTWAAGGEIRFGVLIDFAEHIVPCATGGGLTDAQLVAVELAHDAGNSLALRSSGNLLIFHGRGNLVDELIRSSLHRVDLPQSDEAEKLVFLRTAHAVYSKARFEEHATPEAVAHATANTPNRSLEALLRSSHRRDAVLTLRELTARQSADVEALSDRSLVVLDGARVSGVRLHGRNIAKPIAVLRRLAARLREGERDMPANILLAGAPGSGKTDLALMTAVAAGVTAYELRTPKRGIVGQTESIATLQWDLLRAWAPNVSFVDEVTEALPLERGDFDGDSGASRAVTAALLTALSDESRRGRSLLVASTNCPWRMGDAMRSRFVVLPVLHPLVDDLPGIIVATAARLRSGTALDQEDPAVVEAARLFHLKCASPRDIRQALTNALLFEPALTTATVMTAARQVNVSSVNPASKAFADLWAIRSCSYRAFLPWAEEPETYPYPDYLRSIVDPRTGDVDATALNEAIEAARPHANV